MEKIIDEYKIGHDIIGAAFTVRRNTGRGMLEKFYEKALMYELQKLHYDVKSQVAIPAIYCGEVISEAYRADIVVEDKVIIELKAISSMDDIESCQLYTYLKLSGYKLGYLINFGARDFSIGSLHDGAPFDKGIYRLANKL